MPYYPEPKPVWDHGAYFASQAPWVYEGDINFDKRPDCLVYAYCGACGDTWETCEVGWHHSQDGPDHKVRWEGGESNEKQMGASWLSLR